MKHDPKRLLLEIAGCPVAKSHFENSNFRSPCLDIVATQRAESWPTFQVPEPWSGNLTTAPILFLSSNPSISETEAYPRGDSTDQLLQNFFDRRLFLVTSADTQKLVPQSRPSGLTQSLRVYVRGCLRSDAIRICKTHSHPIRLLLSICTRLRPKR